MKEIKNYTDEELRSTIAGGGPTAEAANKELQFRVSYRAYSDRYIRTILIDNFYMFVDNGPGFYKGRE